MLQVSLSRLTGRLESLTYAAAGLECPLEYSL